MPSSTLPNLTNLTVPQPTMLLYAALFPFGVTDDRKITADALFATITQNISDVSLQFDDGLGTSTVSAAGKGKLRYNDTTKTFQFSADGAAYADFGGTPAAPANSVQFNDAGAFGGNAGFLYDPTSSPNALITAANNAHVALSVVSGAAPSVNIFQVSADAGVTQHLFVDSSGNTTVDGKLTVTGAIDPTSIRLSSGTNLYYESADGQTAAVSAANEGRIRYNQPTQTWQASMNGAAYVNLATGAGMAIGGTVTGGTTGSVLFVGAGPVLAQDNANLFWDDGNNRLGIGTASPSNRLHLFNTAVADDLLVENTAATGQAAFNLKANSVEWNIGGTGSANATFANTFFVNQVGTGIRLNITSAGLVGININSGHGGQLHVVSGNTARPVARFDTASGHDGAVENTTILSTITATANAGNQIAMLMRSTGTPAAGFGGQLRCLLSSNTTADQDAAAIQWLWTTATHATRTSAIDFYPVYQASQARSLRLAGDRSLNLANAAAAPAAAADSFSVWSADAVAGDANAYAINEAGEINRLTGLACRVSTQFDSVDTTLANITGLSRNVEASRVYAFTAVLQTTSDVAAGVKFAIAGTATATSIAYEAVVFQGGVAVATGTQRATALGTTVGDVTAVTTAYVVITGTIVVNAAGTLTVQFAQNVDTGTSSVLINSSFALTAIS